MIKIDTTKWMNAYGMTPKGRGLWAFKIANRIKFIEGTFTEACKEARAIAKHNGAFSITLEA